VQRLGAFYRARRKVNHLGSALKHNLTGRVVYTERQRPMA
jgi:hypothetical protein